MPGIGVSIFLIALGAVMTWAVEVDAEGFNVSTIGVILLIVGAVGLLLSMLFWAPWAPYRSGEHTHEGHTHEGHTHDTGNPEHVH
jgi:hypothetical protein